LYSLVKNHRVVHRSIATERVAEYNEDLIVLYKYYQ